MAGMGLKARNVNFRVTGRPSHNALKSSGTSPNFLITLASLKSPVAGSPVRLKSRIQAAFSAGGHAGYAGIAGGGPERDSPPLGVRPRRIPISLTIVFWKDSNEVPSIIRFRTHA